MLRLKGSSVMYTPCGSLCLKYNLACHHFQNLHVVQQQNVTAIISP